MLSVTFDIDWAPDWCIILCHQICAQYGVRATFFVTHQSSVLPQLRDFGHELGLHPNLHPGSSHGGTREEVLEYVLDLVPDARSMRTHGLVQSSHLFDYLINHTPIKYDASIFLPFHAGLTPTPHYYSLENTRPIIRVPYIWEDDTAAVWPHWNWNSHAPVVNAGIAIHNFHPIFVGLNLDDLASYEKAKAIAGKRPLFELSYQEVEMLINHDRPGARTFLEAFLAKSSVSQFQTVAQLGALAEIQ